MEVNMVTLKLKKPVNINGELTSEIEYDLEGLTGADIQHAVKELGKKGIVVSVTELDSNYHAAIFAEAAGLSLDDVLLLGAKDYNAATTLVRDFFLNDTEGQ
jgi:hypothetical protein